MHDAIFIGIPHGGLEIPPPVRQRMRSDIDAAFIASQSDLCTVLLYSELDCPCAIFPWSRLYVDANRSPEQRGRGGVVPRVDFDQRALYRADEAPDDDEIAVRLDTVHTPYHQAISDRLKTGGFSLFIDGHSMAAMAPPRSPDSGDIRPLAILGNSGNVDGELAADARPLTCPPAFLHLAQQALVRAFAAEPAPEATGLLKPEGEICLNRIFRGGHGVRRHSAPAAGVYGVQLELNQGLWCHPLTHELNAGRLVWMRAVVRRWLAALAPALP